MPDKQGFEIYDKLYPLPEAFRMGDPILVEEVTGLAWGEFSDRMDDPDGDPAVMLGMLAVAVWQVNPRWRRDRVARWVEALNMDDVKFIGDDPEVVEASPPADGSSPADEDSNSRSSKPPGSSSDMSPASTTPVGSLPPIPVSR